MNGKEWLSLAGLVSGASLLILLAAFILTGGSVEIQSIFGRRAQDVRYQNRQASPEMIEARTREIANAYKDLCDPNKKAFFVAAKDTILAEADKLQDISVLPEYQQELVKALRDGSFSCSAIETEAN